MNLHTKADIMLRELNSFSRDPEFPGGNFDAVEALDRSITSLGALKAQLPEPKAAKPLPKPKKAKSV